MQVNASTTLFEVNCQHLGFCEFMKKIGGFLLTLNICSCNSLGEESIDAIATYCTSLQNLNISRLNCITEENLNHLAVSCTRLEVLNLSHSSNLTTSALLQVNTHCLFLKKINLTGTKPSWIENKWPTCKHKKGDLYFLGNTPCLPCQQGKRSVVPN